MYGTHQSLTAVHTILRENDELCLINNQQPSFLAGLNKDRIQAAKHNLIHAAMIDMYSADKFSSCNVPENGKCAVKIPSCVNYALAILIELVFFVAWSQLLLNCWVEGRDGEESRP